MLKSEDLRFFSIVAKENSLAAAARRLNISASAVTQRLQLIERQVGLRLTYRNGRSMILTDEGKILAGRGGRIIGEIEALDEALRVRRGTVSGHLRILAPFGFGRKHIGPLCAEFQELNPHVSVELLLTDRLGKYPEQAWDLAIQVGELHDSALKMRTLAQNHRVVCAAPAYLADRSLPKKPEDLAKHDCLVLRENDEDATLWRFTKEGENTSVRVEPKLSSNDGSVIMQWALAGRGIVVRSEWDVADDIKAKRLMRLLSDYLLPRADIVLLIGSAAEAGSRTRSFIEFLSIKLAATTWASVSSP